MSDEFAWGIFRKSANTFVVGLKSINSNQPWGSHAIFDSDLFACNDKDTNTTDTNVVIDTGTSNITDDTGTTDSVETDDAETTEPETDDTDADTGTSDTDPDTSQIQMILPTQVLPAANTTLEEEFAPIQITALKSLRNFFSRGSCRQHVRG